MLPSWLKKKSQGSLRQEKLKGKGKGKNGRCSAAIIPRKEKIEYIPRRREGGGGGSVCLSTDSLVRLAKERRTRVFRCSIGEKKEKYAPPLNIHYSYYRKTQVCGILVPCMRSRDGRAATPLVAEKEGKKKGGASDLIDEKKRRSTSGLFPTRIQNKGKENKKGSVAEVKNVEEGDHRTPDPANSLLPSRKWEVNSGPRERKKAANGHSFFLRKWRGGERLKVP